MTRAASAPCRVRRPRRALAEGTLLAFVAADRADMALAADAVRARRARMPRSSARFGHRMIDMLVGDPLPRIC